MYLELSEKKELKFNKIKMNMFTIASASTSASSPLFAGLFLI
jgi:hypothetical protein